MRLAPFFTLRRLWILFLISSLGFSSTAWGESIGVLQTEAIAYYRQGNYAAAADLYQKILKKKPNNVTVLKELVWMQWEGKRYPDLLVTARHLTVLTPKNTDAWLMYARALNATGHQKEALETFKYYQRLAPKGVNVQFAIAELEVALKDYDQAKPMVEELIRENPKNGELYAELANIQQVEENYSAAAKDWGIAAQYFPDRPEYRYNEAKELYSGGDPSSAIAKMKILASATPPYAPATEFIVDNAIVSGDLKEAQRILSVILSTVTIESESDFIRLATLYEDTGDMPKCVQTTQRVIDSNPMNGEALFLKAECLAKDHRVKNALVLLEQIAKTNPTSVRAWTNIADSYSMLGQPANALKAVEMARMLDPTNPYILLDQARYLEDANHLVESRALLAKWIHENPDPSIPVLLYHGLTPYPQDVMLASSIHLTVAQFENQMKSLHDAGFHSITVGQLDDWFRRHKDLPSNPVLICFDDARIDSLRYGDPILKKYGFQATMFAPLVNVEGNLVGYADWTMLERYHRTGRWDIQAHGDVAHRSIVIDKQGRTGLFLVNPEWLTTERRLETIDEWTRRIAEDHLSLKTKIFQHLGMTPIAYAWPEGEYGQNSLTPEAAVINLKLARQQFAMSFQQDAYGLNPRSRDPMLLTRLEPPNTWSGKQLVAYLQEHDARTLMMRQLLRQATWSGNTHEADRWLNETIRNGASSANLLADEARIQLSLGHDDLAMGLTGKSLGLEDDPETQELLKDIKSQKPLLWEPTLMFQEDNQGRQRYAFYQRLGDWRTGTTGWSLHQMAGVYQQRNFQTVNEISGGIGVEQPLGLYHSLGLDVTGHHLTGSTADDTYSLIGSLHSSWTDQFRTELQGGRTIFNTAAAIDNNVTIRYVDLRLFWTPSELWSTSFRDHYGDFSDTNHDYLEELQVSRQTAWRPLKAIFRITGDNMTFVSPDYYSPQQLWNFQIGVNYTDQFAPQWKADLTYLPGVGTEKGTSATYVQDVNLEASYQATSQFIIRPEIDLGWTPTYRSEAYLLKLLYSFK